ncbi:MAG: pyruvate dehydrogenase complex dihydrolipoamide acetyltransferase [Leifsonia xyli]|nr:MAG: pyruvate dehydrogenase complex dihydrolipoamide acetyltransferase [Leifsonia xyli]
MATIIRMPEVLAGSAEGAIAAWLVAVGQEIAVGVPLAEVETEKATVEYAAEVEGTVLELLVAEGVSVSVGEPIAVVGAPGEAVPAPEAMPDAVAVPAEAESASAEAVAPSDPAPRAGSAARLFASPLVRRLARERGVELATLTGTGPGGRIVRADLARVPVAEGAAPAAPAPASAPAAAQTTAEDIPLTPMRRAIARRLTESTSTVPHFFLVADCRVDELVALRRRINESTEVKVSLNDFVMKAAAAAYVDVPEANAIWAETAIRRFPTVDLAIAVAIDGGLVTPVLRSVETQTLTQLARNVADLAERARAGRLKQHELEGGSASVSNLGMYGVTEFSAIINPPHSAILAVGAARQQPVVVDGGLAVGTVMTVTLSADHRVLDGALAAQWLAAFVKRIENPLGMLV